MSEKNDRNRSCGGVVIACGCGQWSAGTDPCFEDVFARADAAMYADKTALKEQKM